MCLWRWKHTKHIFVPFLFLSLFGDNKLNYTSLLLLSRRLSLSNLYDPIPNRQLILFLFHLFLIVNRIFWQSHMFPEITENCYFFSIYIPEHISNSIYFMGESHITEIKGSISLNNWVALKIHIVTKRP